MEEKKYALRIPRGIATGIIFEAAEKYELIVEQEKPPEDAFDMTTGMPVKDYVPQMVLRGDSPENLMAAQEYIYKKHEEWIAGVEEWRKIRHEQIRRKIRK
ncbi:MAG: hypothetical protein H0M93_00840 [Methanophagales archaeon]|nr:hypothetical protein [Methanophagales archaeon]